MTLFQRNILAEHQYMLILIHVNYQLMLEDRKNDNMH